MFTEIFALIVTLVVLIFFYDEKFKSKKYLQGIPGPPTLPILGNALDLMISPTKILPKVMKDIGKYGEILLYRLGPFEKGVLVTDYKLIEHILSSTKITHKPYQYEYFEKWLGRGIFTASGALWRFHRKLYAPYFNFSIIVKCINIFESRGDKFIEKLKKEEGKPCLEIEDIVSRCTLDIICETAMGVSVNALEDEDSEYVRSVKTMRSIITNKVIFPINKRFYRFTPSYYREKKAVEVLHSFADNIIDEKIKSRNNKNGDAVDEDVTNSKNFNLLDLLLDLTVDDKPLTRLQIRGELNGYMFGGHDTVTGAIAFALYTLAERPDIQERVLEEQRKIFGNYIDSNVTVSDLQEMKYLELVIKETLRLYPSGPMIARRLAEDLEWGGTVFPKGQILGIFVLGIHRNPKYYPDPEKFIPERFQNNEEITPFSFIPFSAGPRNCLGQMFAMLEMKSIISKVIRNFELHPAEPTHTLQLSLEIILQSANGICISLKKRKWV